MKTVIMYLFVYIKNVLNCCLNQKIHGIILLLVNLVVLTDSTQAFSFPFRNVTIGKPAPNVTFVNSANKNEISLQSFSGTPLMVVFWGGDLATKKKRALKTLRLVAGLKSYLNKNGVSLLVVNPQNDSKNILTEVMNDSGISVPLYVDNNLEAYGKLGIFIMPSILFIDAKGIVVNGIGYSSDIAQRLPGMIDVLLGKMTLQELKARLNPDIKIIPREIRQAKIHMKFGISMKNKGRPEVAIRELTTALQLDPQLTAARLELGCLWLEYGRLDEATRQLEKTLEMQPDSIRSKICQARLSAALGDTKNALHSLQMLMPGNGHNPRLHYVTGTIHELMGANDKAAVEYRQAYELLRRR